MHEEKMQDRNRENPLSAPTAQVQLQSDRQAASGWSWLSPSEELLINGRLVAGTPQGTAFAYRNSNPVVIVRSNANSPVGHALYVDMNGKQQWQTINSHFVAFVTNNASACRQLIDVVTRGLNHLKKTKKELEQIDNPLLLVGMSTRDFLALGEETKNALAVFVTRFERPDEKEQIRREYEQLEHNRLLVILDRKAKYTVRRGVKLAIRLFGQSDPTSYYRLKQGEPTSIPTGRYVCEPVKDRSTGKVVDEHCELTETNVLNNIVDFLTQSSRDGGWSKTQIAALAGVVGAGIGIGLTAATASKLREMRREHKWQQNQTSIIGKLMNLIFFGGRTYQDIWVRTSEPESSTAYSITRYTVPTGSNSFKNPIFAR